MPSSYPGGLDNFSTSRSDSTSQASTHATDHNNANDALNKIEAELGVTPKGSDASVAARLARMDTAALAALGTTPQGTDASVAARLSRLDTLGLVSTIVSASGTSLVLREAPGLLQKGRVIAVGVGANCEIRGVSNVSGSNVTLNTALERSHSAGEFVYLSPDTTFHPALFGCLGDNSTDDWQGLQRMLYQVAKVKSGFNGNYGPIIDGGGLTYRIQQPLTFTQHTMRNLQFNAFTTFAPNDTNNAMMMSSSQGHYAITSTAVDDTFVCSGGAVFPNVNEPIVFNNMYGETLPGGIVSGRVYYIKTRPDATHVTVSATKGGATFDVTSDGAGWAAGQIALLSKFWWENVTINVSFADLNGLAFGMQQPGEIKRLRINMTQACSRATYGASLQSAQICRIYDPEFVVTSATNVVGLGIGPPTVLALADVSVTGVHVNDANFAGSGASGQTHAVIGGGFVVDGVILDGHTWLESAGDTGIKIDSASTTVRGVDLGNLYVSGAPTNGAVVDNGTNGDWEVGKIFWSSSNKTFVTTGDSVVFNTNGSTSNEEAVGGKSFGGLRKPNGQGPILKERVFRSTSASITARYIDQTIVADSSAATRTITLRSAVGMSGHRQTIKRSGANNVTVATTSSQTIDLPGGTAATTRTLGNDAAFITVESNGSNWVIVAIGGTVT